MGSVIVLILGQHGSTPCHIRLSEQQKDLVFIPVAFFPGTDLRVYKERQEAQQQKSFPIFMIEIVDLSLHPLQSPGSASPEGPLFPTKITGNPIFFK